MIYVDTFNARYRGMIMCHMATDGDLEELHEMADKIGVNRKWFQYDQVGDKILYGHYDICKAKKALAIKFGAIEVNPRDLIKKCYTGHLEIMISHKKGGSDA